MARPVYQPLDTRSPYVKTVLVTGLDIIQCHVLVRYNPLGVCHRLVHRNQSCRSRRRHPHLGSETCPQWGAVPDRRLIWFRYTLLNVGSLTWTRRTRKRRSWAAVVLLTPAVDGRVRRLFPPLRNGARLRPSATEVNYAASASDGKVSGSHFERPEEDWHSGGIESRRC